MSPQLDATPCSDQGGGRSSSLSPRWHGCGDLRNCITVGSMGSGGRGRSRYLARGHEWLPDGHHGAQRQRPRTARQTASIAPQNLQGQASGQEAKGPQDPLHVMRSVDLEGLRAAHNAQPNRHGHPPAYGTYGRNRLKCQEEHITLKSIAVYVGRSSGRRTPPSET
mgnify:CR=1 FL=1